MEKVEKYEKISKKNIYSSSHDANINRSKECGNYDYSTNPYSTGKDYLGIDDIDRIRRRKIR